MKHQNAMRSFFSTLLSFMMALAIFLGIFSSFLAFATYKPYFTAAVVRKSGYASEAQKELKEEFISYGHASNIQESFFEKFFAETMTEEFLKKDTESIVRNFFNGAEETVNTDAVKTALFEQLKIYATQEGFHLDKTLEKNLLNIAEELSTFYRDYLSILSGSYFKTASNMLLKFRTYLWYGIGASAFVFLVAAVILALFYKKQSNRLRFYIYATSASALMLLVAPLTLLFMGVAEKINIGSASLYNFVTGMMKGFLGTTAMLSIIPILLTVILALGYCTAKKAEEKTA